MISYYDFICNVIFDSEEDMLRCIKNPSPPEEMIQEKHYFARIEKSIAKLNLHTNLADYVMNLENKNEE